MSSPYSAAPPEKLDEIIRLAEARLNAQLKLGIAANQRAMTFASMLAAIAAALVVVLSALSTHWLWLPLVILLAGFVLATGFAAWSAQPVAWDIPGYRPSDWLDDIPSGDSLHNGRAAMAEHYDEAIQDNQKAMQRGANWVYAAVVAVIAALVCAGTIAAVVGH